MMIFIPPNDFSCADSRLPSVSILICCEGSWTVAQKESLACMEYSSIIS